MLRELRGNYVGISGIFGATILKVSPHPPQKSPNQLLVTVHVTLLATWTNLDHLDHADQIATNA